MLTSAFTASHAYAGSIDFGPTQISTITEGNSGDFTVTVTNNLGFDISLDEFGAFAPTALGDSSDGISRFVPGFDLNCFIGPLVNGASCTFDSGVETDSGLGERDGDSGKTSIQNIFVEYKDTNGTSQRWVDPNTIELTVKDIPAPTPEPATLTLLGSGVLGLVGVIRKRRKIS